MNDDIVSIRGGADFAVINKQGIVQGTTKKLPDVHAPPDAVASGESGRNTSQTPNNMNKDDAAL